MFEFLQYSQVFHASKVNKNYYVSCKIASNRREEATMKRDIAFRIGELMKARYLAKTAMAS